MKIKKAMLFVMLFMIGMICVNVKYIQGEESSDKGGVSLSPAYLDIGNIKEKDKSYTLTVMNTGKTLHLKAKIDNASNARIKLTPDAFTLSENEQKKVTLTILKDDTMKVGVYDLSIAFISDTEGEQSITAYGTNSLRLRFRKEGLALATCNVKDISPIQEVPFYSILCNFYYKRKTVNANIEIKNKATGKVIWQQDNMIMMESYPVSGYYGQIDTPLQTTPWECGDYSYSLVAKQDKKILLTYQTDFNVGERKGKLEKVTTKDICKGDMAEFKALIRNIGTQILPVSVQIYVKDNKENLVYSNIETSNIPMKQEKNFYFKWPTKYSSIGRYTIEYYVIMGDQQEKGTLQYNVKLPAYIWWIMIILLIILIILCYIISKHYRFCLRKHYND